METETTYKYQDLSDTAKEYAIQKHRQDGFNYDWWDSVYEMVKEDSKGVGFTIESIYFSGFWNQGDGACWEGYVDIEEWLEVNCPNSIGISAWRQLVQEEYITKTLKVTHSGHYSHENTMRFEDLDFSLDPDPEEASTNGFYMAKERSVFAGMEWKLLLDIIKTDPQCPYKNIEQLQEAIEESAKDFARDVYKRLQEEYDYLTSDESISEIIQANDYNFTNEGELA